MPAKVDSTIEVQYSRNAFESALSTIWKPTPSDSVIFHASNGYNPFSLQAVTAQQLWSRRTSLLASSLSIVHNGDTIALGYLGVNDMANYALYTEYYPDPIDDQTGNINVRGGQEFELPVPGVLNDTLLRNLNVHNYVGFPVTIYFQYESKDGRSYVNMARIDGWIRSLSQDRGSIELCDQDGTGLKLKANGTASDHWINIYQHDGKTDDPPVFTGANRNQMLNSTDVLDQTPTNHQINFFVAFNGFFVASRYNSWKLEEGGTISSIPLPDGQTTPFKLPDGFEVFKTFDGQTIAYPPNRILNLFGRTDTSGYIQPTHNNYDPAKKQMLLNDPQPNNQVANEPLTETMFVNVVSSVVQPELIDDSTGAVIARSKHIMVLTIPDRTKVGFAEVPINLSSPVRPKIRVRDVNYDIVEIVEQSDETLVITIESA